MLYLDLYLLAGLAMAEYGYRGNKDGHPVANAWTYAIFIVIWPIILGASIYEAHSGK